MVTHTFIIFSLLRWSSIFSWRKADALVTFPLRTVTFPWSASSFLYFYGIVGILIDGVDDIYSQRSGRQSPSVIMKIEILISGAVEVLSQRSGGNAPHYVYHITSYYSDPNRRSLIPSACIFGLRLAMNIPVGWTSI